MDVREATPADARAVGAVHQRAIAELGARAYGEEQVAAWRGGREPADYDLDFDDRPFVVAEVDGTVVGFGSVDLDPVSAFARPVDAEVTGVYVHPDHARSGVGSALLADLESRARRWDAAAVGLQASLNAVGFYERMGYERVREHEHEFRGGATGTVVEMRRVL